MTSIAELRRKAREHAQQLQAVRYLTSDDLAQRWGITDDTVRAIPRAWLPYMEFGETRKRRYDPRDVEKYEADEKAGLHVQASGVPQ